MTTYFVYFADETESVVLGYFGSHADDSVFPYQAELDEDDPRMQVYLHPELQPAYILMMKQRQKDALLLAASQAMTPIFVSLQLDTSDETTLVARAWQNYYQELKLVPITVEDEPVWPPLPE